MAPPDPTSPESSPVPVDKTDGESVGVTEAERLRAEKYNATIIAREDVHPELAKFRIRPDEGFAAFEPGQYVTLGLGNWEPRLVATQAEELTPVQRRKLVRRAYSISSPMVSGVTAASVAQGDPGPPGRVVARAVSVNSVDYLEFYVTLVRYAGSTEAKPPALTPRLFCKGVGDRVSLGKKIAGNYRLGDIAPNDTVLMLGTGTGEAPHNAMAAELVCRGHLGRIVIATSLRLRSDAGYLAEHAALASIHPGYQYLPLTTREPENLDPSVDGFVGKQYLQDVWSSGSLAEAANCEFSPADTHVFLCGNPAMIGYVPPGAAPPATPGMLPLLQASGFTDAADAEGPGQIRFEKYW